MDGLSDISWFLLFIREREIYLVGLGPTYLLTLLTLRFHADGLVLLTTI